MQQPAQQPQQHTPLRLPITTHKRQITTDEPEPAPAVPPTPHAAPRTPSAPAMRQRNPHAASRTPLNTAMRQPNRLDAHGYGPQRAPDPTYQEFRGPYLADDEPWEDFCPGLQASVKRLRLQKLRDASSDDDDDDDVVIKDDGHTVNLYNYLNTEFAYMTGKAAKSEINIRQLDPSDRALFDVSMQKEWTS